MPDNDTDKKETKPDVLPGLVPVDPNVLQDFLKEMNEQVIPDILKVVEERRLLAAESWQWQLKC